jgi:hypothetical protein
LRRLNHYRPARKLEAVNWFQFPILSMAHSKRAPASFQQLERAYKKATGVEISGIGGQAITPTAKVTCDWLIDKGMNPINLQSSFWTTPTNDEALSRAHGVA